MNERELRQRMRQLDESPASVPEFHTLLRRPRTHSPPRARAILAVAGLFVVLASAVWTHWQSAREARYLAMAQELSRWSAPSDAWPAASASPLLQPVALSSSDWLAEPNPTHQQENNR